MPKDNVDFYFDFISPYAYLAWKQIGAIASAASRDVIAKPILFAALLNHHGQKGPAEIPEKRIYTFKNVLRLAHFAGTPVRPPPAHPFNPLLALRAASADMDETTRTKLVDALFDLTWGHASVEGARGVTDPKHVAEAARRAGLDAAVIALAAESQAMKDRVRQTTEEAITKGAFGVPTMIAGGELFWGVDSLPHLAAYLRGEDPASAARLAGFADVPVGAERKSS